MDQHPSGEVTLVNDHAVVKDNAPNVPHPVMTEHVFTPPSVQHPTAITYTLPAQPSAAAGTISLIGYDTITEGQSLRLTLYWRGRARMA